jgi:hypothetical protein
MRPRGRRADRGGRDGRGRRGLRPPARAHRVRCDRGREREPRDHHCDAVTRSERARHRPVRDRGWDGHGGQRLHVRVRRADLRPGGRPQGDLRARRRGQPFRRRRDVRAHPDLSQPGRGRGRFGPRHDHRHHGAGRLDLVSR